MGNLAEMLAKLDASSSPSDNQVIRPHEHSALANGGAESDKVVSLFWSKDRFNAPGPEEIAHSDSLKNADVSEEASGVPVLKIIGTIFLTAIVIGLWHSQLRTRDPATAPVEAAPVSAAFTPGSTTLQETAPLPDAKTPLEEEVPSKVDNASWDDTLNRYEKLLTQKEGTAQEKDKESANEQLLDRLETWMKSQK